MNVLVLNCRSNSIRFAVVHASNGHEHVFGSVTRLGTRHATLEFEHEGRKGSREVAHAEHALALREIDALVQELGLRQGIIGIGHRVAHGGMKFSGSMLVTPEVIAKIRECIPLGPLHNPSNVLGIEVMQELFPGMPQVAVFDTAFHQTMPPRAYLYAVPMEWFEQHEVRRYGFHGTSHRWVSRHAVTQLGLDPKDHSIVTAHLGYGCSLASIRNGESQDTTMGLTPLDGLVMDTRSGTIDPSIVAHMKEALDCSAETVMDALRTRSGLLGISGLSHDMQTLQEAAGKGHARAALAIDKFCFSVAKATMSMTVGLGRLDALVFTGGIGENNAPVRAKIVESLAFLGMKLDPVANARNGAEGTGLITAAGTKPMAAVVPTNEELQIAMDTAELVTKANGQAA